MGRRRFVRRAIGLGAAIALLSPAAAQARDMYMTDNAGNLLRADSRFPGVVQDSVAISGLPAGTSLVGIDFRPLTGDLVGVGSNSVVYNVVPATGVATAVGAGFAPGLTGTSFGVDNNPAADALRITSDSNQNYRLSNATGNHAATTPTAAGSPDGVLNPGDPTVVASAYINSSFTATRPAATTLYAIDSAANALYTQVPPNAGTLTNPLPLGLDVSEQTGFDIAGAGNLGYMVTTPAGRSGAVLYRVDIITGKTTELGPIGTGSLVRGKGTPRAQITGLAARQDQAVPKANVAPAVDVVKTTIQPRPGQRAAYIAYATDRDGSITKVEWDVDGDGSYDDGAGQSLRVGLRAGTRTIAVRVTDDGGARTVGTTRVRIAR